jgi:hypothetical protein
VSLKGIYGCHQPLHVNMLMGALKPFLIPKLRSRVGLFGGDTGAMLAAAGLDPLYVPSDFGGTNDAFDFAWYLRAELPEGFTANDRRGSEGDDRPDGLMGVKSKAGDEAIIPDDDDDDAAAPAPPGSPEGDCKGSPVIASKRSAQALAAAQDALVMMADLATTTEPQEQGEGGGAAAAGQGAAGGDGPTPRATDAEVGEHL